MFFGKTQDELIDITHNHEIQMNWFLLSHVAANYEVLTVLTRITTGKRSEQHHVKQGSRQKGNMSSL